MLHCLNRLKRGYRAAAFLLAMIGLGTFAGAGYEGTAISFGTAADSGTIKAAGIVKAAEKTTSGKAASENKGKEEIAAVPKSAGQGLTSLTRSKVTYIIALDPGHGGNDTGADGWNSSEKRLNLLIGTYLKKELERYDHVKVVMTRKDDVYVGLHDRMKIARKKHADLLVSLHNDSWDPGTPYDNGSSILIAKKGSYRPEMAVQELYLARSILYELEKLGLVNRGLVRKKSTRVARYEDGSTGDYHAIIRDGMKLGIPSILVEHAFCDSKHDYTRFLKTNKQLKALAAADARGIARYLGLREKETGETLKPIKAKGNKQLRAQDPEAYYTLAQKAYYIELYDNMMQSGVLRHQTNLNQADDKRAHTGLSKENAQAQEEKEKELMLAQEAARKAHQIRQQNTAAAKKMPRILLMILGGFAVLLLIREFDFGFSIRFRVRRRGERYTGWKRWKMEYHYDNY